MDVSLLRSDRSRRDRAIRSRWLESATFPLATFKVTEVRGFPADPAEGEPIDFQLVGDMTVKETTREVVWDVTAYTGRRPAYRQRHAGHLPGGLQHPGAQHRRHPACHRRDRVDVGLHHGAGGGDVGVAQEQM
ncbi:MAG: YceI family protein [Caldilineaceae bacterium]